MIWHFQGSGKSLLMVFAAQKLRLHPRLGNPTVVIGVDRIDLDTQITATFNAADVPNMIGCATRQELQTLLGQDVRLKIDKAAIDEAYKQITGNLSEQDRDDLAKRAAKMAVLVKDPERIRAVVGHIATHFQQTVEPNGFKAQVVVFDRECCVLYKQAMDELIAPEASAVIMTAAQGDPPEWRQHVRDKDAEEKLLDRFRDPADPLQFVIVTSKLLTGFDAPILQVMYLDKPMKDHNLLQAICRTNRTFGQKKTHGLIVDYIGIFDDVARALDFDEKAVQQVVSNIEELRKTLPAQVAKCLAFFAGVDRTVGGYEGLSAAQQCLPNNETRDKFAAEYIVLGTIWEALSPDPCLSPYEKAFSRDRAEATPRLASTPATRSAAALLRRCFLMTHRCRLLRVFAPMRRLGEGHHFQSILAVFFSRSTKTDAWANSRWNVQPSRLASPCGGPSGLSNSGYQSNVPYSPFQPHV